MDPFLLYYFWVWWPLSYILIFLGMVFEGDVILFIVAFFVHRGFFNFLAALLIVVGGVLIGDLWWWWLGRTVLRKRIENSSSLLLGWVERVAKPFDSHIIQRPFHTIFISKFAYGMHHAILVRAGILNLDGKRLFKCDIVASFFWILIVGGLGYFSSASFSLMRHYLRFAETVLLLGIVVFIFLWHFVAEILKKWL